MSLLLYCILRSLPGSQPPGLIGINDGHMLFVTAGELSGAVSRVAASQLALNPSRILAYERVVARLHFLYTVIPMRYGCVLDEEYRVVRLIEERRDRFSALLEELAGCVEMGVRVLPDLSEAQACEAQDGAGCQSLPGAGGRALPRRDAGLAGGPGAIRGRKPGSEIGSAIPDSRYPISVASPGSDYLAAQRLRYAQNDGLTAARRASVEKVFAAFSGLFVKWKEECSTPGLGQSVPPAPLFSLYFLVPAESVEAFCKRFHEINNERAGLLLTGPWAPYNFVSC